MALEDRPAARREEEVAEGDRGLPVDGSGEDRAAVADGRMGVGGDRPMAPRLGELPAPGQRQREDARLGGAALHVLRRLRGARPHGELRLEFRQESERLERRPAGAAVGGMLRIGDRHAADARIAEHPGPLADDVERRFVPHPHDDPPLPRLEDILGRGQARRGEVAGEVDVGAEEQIGLEARPQLLHERPGGAEGGEQVDVGEILLEGVGQRVEAGAQIGGRGDADARRRRHRSGRLGRRHAADRGREQAGQEQADGHHGGRKRRAAARDEGARGHAPMVASRRADPAAQYHTPPRTRNVSAGSKGAVAES